MSTPTPSVATLIRGMPSGSADILRRVMNQQALERAGHVQAVPMTIEGMAKMKSLVHKAFEGQRTVADRVGALAAAIKVRPPADLPGALAGLNDAASRADVLMALAPSMEVAAADTMDGISNAREQIVQMREDLAAQSRPIVH